MTDLVVLEVAGSIAGAYAAKLFSDQGATVIKVEAPWTRALVARCFFDTSKRSRLVDWKTDVGARELDEWAQRADVVIESAAPAPLHPVVAPDPGRVHVHVSPFGSSGPYSGFTSNAFTDDAISGHLYLNGAPEREPVTRPGPHALLQAGLHGFIGALAALRARDAGAGGQTVEVSHFEGMASLHQHTVTMYTHGGFVAKREGNRQPGYWHPVGAYGCRDGHVFLGLPTGAYVEPFLVAADLAHLVLDPRFADDLARGANKDAFDAAIQPWLDKHTAAEIIALGQSVGAPIGPVYTPAEALRDPHLAERDAFATLPDGMRVPRGPFRIDGHGADVRAAPAIGELTDAPDTLPARPDPAARRRGLERGPLDGIRVLDLTRVWAGPLAGRMLADLGADVILVEAPNARGVRNVPAAAADATHLFADNDIGKKPWNRNGGFNKLARNKRSVTLPLDRPEGKAAFEALVSTADVVLENYAPRVMGKLGLDFEHLRGINPSLVYVSLSGFGTTGRYRDWVAFGPLIEAATGLSSRLGYEDSGPYRSGVAWPDPVSGLHAVAATLTALRARDSDPERAARRVEVSMIEAMSMFVGDLFVESQRTGRDPARTGNRSGEFAPQGVYPCRGDDRWIAISVESDDQWRALCDELSLSPDLRELDLAARRARHDTLDAAITERTTGAEPDACMERLQSRGIPAATVADAQRLVADPHLAARGFWARLDHRDAGPHDEPGNALRFERTPVTFRRAAPAFGEHNAEVLREAGMIDTAIEALVAAGVLIDAPPA